jgi:hypothetical protein
MPAPWISVESVQPLLPSRLLSLRYGGLQGFASGPVGVVQGILFHVVPYPPSSSGIACTIDMRQYKYTRILGTRGFAVGIAASQMRVRAVPRRSASCSTCCSSTRPDPVPHDSTIAASLASSLFSFPNTHRGPQKEMKLFV